MRKYLARGLDEKAGSNFSWRATFAGVVTFLAILILLSFIGTAIGFGAPDYTTSNPFEHVGMELVIWTIVTLVLSFGAGGYIAGITANRAGFIHGFLTWAVSLISIVILMTTAVSSIFGAVGSIIGTTTKTVGNITEEAASGVATLSQESFDAITENTDVDTEELEGNVNEVLEDTDIPELQPDYLQGQVNDTNEDIKDAGYNVVVKGNDVDSEVDSVVSNIEERLDTIDQGLDKDALTTAITDNTDLSEDEADDAADNIIDTYEKTSEQASESLQQAKGEIEDLQVKAKQAEEEAPKVAEEVTDDAAKYSLYAFIGLLISLFVTAFAGQAGAKTYHDVHADNEAVK